MATQNLVTCTCNNCRTVLCISANAWTEITPSYSTCVSIHRFSHIGLDQIPQNRQGLKDSELEGCTVQALHCRSCQQLVGLRCVAVTQDKEQYRDRAFVKLEKMTLKTMSTGEAVQPIIAHRPNGDAIILPASTNVPPASVKQPPVRTNPPPASKKNTPRPPSGNSLAPSSRNESSRKENGSQENELRQLVKRQDGDITLLFKTLDNLQQDVLAIAEGMKAMRAQEKESRTVANVAVLADNVTQVNRKLGEVDSLKLEVQLMQAQIKHLEEEQQYQSVSKKGGKKARRSLSFGKAQTTTTRRLSEKLGSLQPSQDSGTAQVDPSLHPSSPALDDSHFNSSKPDPQGSRTKARKPRYAAEAARRRSHLARTILALQQENSHDSAPPTFPTRDNATSDEQSPEGFFSDGEENVDDGGTRKRRRTSNLSTLSPDPVTNALEYPSPPSAHPGPYHTFPGPDHHFSGPDSERAPICQSVLPTPAYRSIWAPDGPFRDEHGLMITREGRIDGRSLRFEGKGHYKRDGPRDEEGYLLRANGQRDKRSVRIIDAMKKRQEEREKREGEAMRETPEGSGIGVAREEGREEKGEGEGERGERMVTVMNTTEAECPRPAAADPTTTTSTATATATPSNENDNNAAGKSTNEVRLAVSSEAIPTF